LYLFFASSDYRWYMSVAEDMRAGKAAGWVSTVDAEPDALSPDQVKGAWEVWDNAGKAWVAAPNARVRQVSGRAEAGAGSESVRQWVSLGGTYSERS
jgi:hypothetical protein